MRLSETVPLKFYFVRLENLVLGVCHDDITHGNWWRKLIALISLIMNEPQYTEDKLEAGKSSTLGCSKFSRRK